jgi:hypothetical protein
VKEEPEDVDEKKPFHLNNFQNGADTFIDLTALSISDILQQPSGSMFLLQVSFQYPSWWWRSCMGKKPYTTITKMLCMYLDAIIPFWVSQTQ